MCARDCCRISCGSGRCGVRDGPVAERMALLRAYCSGRTRAARCLLWPRRDRISVRHTLHETDLPPFGDASADTKYEGRCLSYSRCYTLPASGIDSSSATHAEFHSPEPGSARNPPTTCKAGHGLAIRWSRC